MESGGMAGKIHLSDSTKSLALKTSQAFEFVDRGVSKVEVLILY
jgi:hypothetical protein